VDQHFSIPRQKASPFFHLHNPLPTETITRNEDTLLCQLNGLSVALHPISFSELGFPFYLAIPNVGNAVLWFLFWMK
jgi:hypothetical protein